MKIPFVDGLVRGATLAAHGAGLLPTARGWTPGQAAGARGILVVVSTALGDSICLTPVLEALRAGLPDTRLVGLYHAAFASLYAGDPRLDAVIPYYGKYRRVRETLAAIRAAKCDIGFLAYIAEPDVVPLVRLGGCRTLIRTVGRGTRYARMMANADCLRAGPATEHAITSGLRTAALLGCPAVTERPALAVPDAARRRVEARLLAHGLPRDTRRIVLHPGASAQNKRWPAERFVWLGRRLLEADPSARLLLTGAPSERALAERIACELGQPPRVLLLAGELSLVEVAALLAGADLLVSADTGIAHAAYAVGTPSVTLFWRSEPRFSGPLHDRERHRVIAREPLCPSCRTGNCRYPDCALDIRGEQVLQAALELLAAGAAVAKECE
ncbi:MAG: glycosyltransferase family 9 protein [Candidatus Methylomirabilales bacterium]